ncbi:MAG: hypothetical protein ACRD88_03020 [Terriglobia bacterium]
MRTRLFSVIGVAAIAIAAVALLRMTSVSVEGQNPAAPGTGGASANPSPAPPATKTAWGEPDLQGIWTDPYQTPLQRPAQFGGKELFTDEERAELDRQRAGILRRDARSERGTERDVSGAYNAVFQSVRPTGKRTSLIVDPPDGRIPPLTPEVEKRNQAEREYRLALLQATETCKNQEPGCAGGKYGPPSPRRAEMPPLYNTVAKNRNDNPEDRSLSERCMAAALPDFNGYRRIVQAPKSVAIFYDTGQGQGWQRIIPVDGPVDARPHLPSSIRLRFGDSRGRWEGDTLVVDVTNFSPKYGYLDSRENRRLVERWTRVDANTIEYAVTINDPTTWTKPWAVKQELVRQDERANRIYYEPRCHEGNYGLAGMLLGARVQERAFARGEGPDPATMDTTKGFDNEGGADALTGNSGAIF